MLLGMALVLLPVVKELLLTGLLTRLALEELLLLALTLSWLLLLRLKHVAIEIYLDA